MADHYDLDSWKWEYALQWNCSRSKDLGAANPSLYIYKLHHCLPAWPLEVTSTVFLNTILLITIVMNAGPQIQQCKQQNFLYFSPMFRSCHLARGKEAISIISRVSFFFSLNSCFVSRTQYSSKIWVEDFWSWISQDPPTPTPVRCPFPPGPFCLSMQVALCQSLFLNPKPHQAHPYLS